MHSRKRNEVFHMEAIRASKKSALGASKFAALRAMHFPHSSETYGSCDFGWDTGLGKVAGNSDEVGGGGVVIEQDAEGIGGEARRAWRRSFASSSQVH